MVEKSLIIGKAIRKLPHSIIRYKANTTSRSPGTMPVTILLLPPDVDRIRGVMVSMPASIVVDHGFEPWSNQKTMLIVLKPRDK
jgi:hypothetical protein